jgi:CHAT domain-containing protein
LLIDRFSLVRTINGPELIRKRWDRISPSSTAVVFADPFLRDPNLRFPPLSSAREEGDYVAKLFRYSRLVTGEKADAAAFKTAAIRVQILHFAGHGVRNGDLGGLLVAGDPPFLATREISHLDLSRLRLVVLAACSAGFGGGAENFDADTLVRGFLMAGAARVIAPSWDVNSNATYELIRKFYAELLSGETTSEALRQAMLSLRAQTATSHPYNWAAFQLYGTP